VPYITTVAAAKAAAEGITDFQKGDGGVMSLQEYHRKIV
jgi:carbamoyl-phosphate synthase large subunit